MSLKAVSFFIESDSDIVLTINNISYGIFVAGMHAPHPQFWIQADQDNVDDLCTTIDTGITSISGTFERADTSTYTISSVDFVGARPQHRPH